MKGKAFLIYTIVTFLMMTVLSGVVYLAMGGKLYFREDIWSVLQGVLCIAYLVNLIRTAYQYGKSGNSGGLLGLVLATLMPLLALSGTNLGGILPVYLAPTQPLYAAMGIGQYAYLLQTLLAVLSVGVWFLSRTKREVSGS